MELVYEGTGLKVIEFSEQMGRNRITWVLLENRHGNRFSTFVPREALREAIREWRHRISFKKLIGDYREAVSQAMLEVFHIGQIVYHRSTRICGQVLSFGFNNVGKAAESVDWGNGETKEFAIDLEPC